MSEPRPNENGTAATFFEGPIRDPDACVLACADCSCRQRLEEHFARCEREREEAQFEVAQ